MKGLIERRFFTLKTTGEAKLVTREQRDDSGSELPQITGYTAVFGVDTEIQSWYGTFTERIQKGAFRRAIREGQNVRALRNHEPDNLLGTTLSKTCRIKEDDIGLFIEVDTPDTTLGRDTVELIRRGDLSGMSFAFVVRQEKWVAAEDGTPQQRIIQDVDLYDVGPVTYPAYPQTSANIRSVSIAHRQGYLELGVEAPVLPEEPVAPVVVEALPGNASSSAEPVAVAEATPLEVQTEPEPVAAEPVVETHAQALRARMARIALAQLDLKHPRSK